MKLTTVELNNICQYRTFSADFSPGLTLIMGKNGSGKSNLVKSIYAAVSGDFSRNDGIKTDNISQFAKETDTASIRVVFEHNDSKLDIIRGLRPATTRLQITTPDSGVTNITKAQEATDAIASILGVSSRMLSDYVFVDQWTIFDFLSMIPSLRAKAFQRLFRTEQAEQLHKILNSHIDHIVIPTPGINRDIVTQRVKSLNQQLLDCIKALDLVNATLTNKSLDKYTAVINLWKQKQQIILDIAHIQSRLNTLVEDAKNITTHINKCRQDDKWNALPASHLDDYIKSKTVVNSWQTYEQIEATKKNLNTRLQEIAIKFKTLVKPERPDNFIGQSEEYRAVWTDYATIKKELDIAKYYISLMNTSAPFCPTCGTPAHVLKTHKEEYETIIASKQHVFDELTKQIEISTEYVKESNTYNATITRLTNERNNINTQLSQLPNLTCPDESKEALELRIKLYDDMQVAHDVILKTIDSLQAEYNRLAGMQKQLEDDLKIKNAALNGISVTKEDVDQAVVAIDKHKFNQQKQMELIVQKDGLNRMINDDMLALKDIDAVDKQADVLRQWVDNCEQLRDIFHRDSLPNIAARNYLDLMNTEINNLLVEFDSPFMIHTDDTLSFVATFKDGRKIPSGRLSGGEKVILALAFRVAVNDIFAKDLGLLVLDEPTAGLDEGNLACLRIAISRLKELSSSRGLQVIVITHETDLHNLFDHVIEVGKDG